MHSDLAIVIPSKKECQNLEFIIPNLQNYMTLNYQNCNPDEAVQISTSGVLK